MARAIVNTPVKGFTGEVAGVAFANGTADVDDPTALSYFERRGYEVIYAPEEVVGEPVEPGTGDTPAEVTLADGSPAPVGDDGIPVLAEATDAEPPAAEKSARRGSK